jgi:hypothetical protein
MTVDQIVEFWKSNERPMGLIKSVEAVAWANNNLDAFEMFTGSNWVSHHRYGGSLKDDQVYRVKPDYKPKVGCWVECPVTYEKDLHKFKRRPLDGARYLTNAACLRGFGGIKYRGVSGGISDWSLTPLGTTIGERFTDSAPHFSAIPILVRFWEE